MSHLLISQETATELQCRLWLSWKILLLIVLLVFPFSVMGGPAFCTNVQPLDPDPFEVQPDLIDPDVETDDNEINNAKFVEVPTQNFRSHTFHDGPDEDWIMFEGRASDPFGPPIAYRAQVINLGLGIFLTDTGGNPNPDEGTGIRLEAFESNGMPVTDFSGDPVDSFKPGGSPSITSCDDSVNPLFPISIEFEVPTDGAYFIRVSQCRNAPEFAPLNLCIPDGASYDFQMGFTTGLDAGKLSGVITDELTGQPVIFATINSIDLNNFTFSLPGYSGIPDGSFTMSDTVERASTEAITATITMDPAYQPATVEFTLTPGMTTNCNVSLTPVGVEIAIFKNGFENPPNLKISVPKGVPPPDCTRL